jgi:Flp pilus assembly protein protease CpaA
VRELFAKPFFPDAGFAWVFVALLLTLAGLAAVYDTRTAIIPKWITLGTLAVGVVVNTVRGAWLGSLGSKVWLISETSLALGALDGFLFALVGFAAGFGLFFVMWVLGVCGGGDVKLMAALSAWFGPIGVALLLIVSTAVLFVWVLGSVVFGGGSLKQIQKASKSAQPPQAGGKSRQRRVTFSVPAAVASLIIVFWVFGEDLGVKSRKATPQSQGDARVSDSPERAA